MNQNQLVQPIIDAMLLEVAKYKLEILQRYPADLLVVDRGVLDKIAVPGAMFAWMVGDSHTHLTMLGVHPESNGMVKCLINMSENDRFYVFSVTSPSKFSYKELTRDEFLALQSTRLAYERNGSVSNFYLSKGKSEVGYVSLENTGTLREPEVTATITPIYGFSELDRAALDVWSGQSIIEFAHTIFVKPVLVWAEPYKKAA